jgi:Asp-tRNA(Asn)/Glu-tRNA(Gln) amidotransferase B subunit
VRTELKNINSFRFLERAIAFEIERQIDVLESGGRVVRETRLYDAERDETRSMRSKELSDDYRYFPDPDLLPVHVSDALIAEVRASLPELPAARRHRYVSALGAVPLRRPVAHPGPGGGRPTSTPPPGSAATPSWRPTGSWGSCRRRSTGPS